MNESYEFKTLKGSLYDQYLMGELQKLGDQGWEITEVETGGDFFSPYRSFFFRKPAHGTPGPDSWEYHKFHDDSFPNPEWRNHLSSCGWIIIEPRIDAYGVRPFHIAKRPGWWRGTDDGDIEARLKDLGWKGWDLSEENVREILEAKWIQSQEQGRNIGTYEAARHWLANR